MFSPDQIASNIPRPNTITFSTPAALACIGVASFFFILRGVGLEPIVFADEWTHSINSRLLALSEVTSPSYLYYFLYRPTRACGVAFLDCARLINIAVFAIAALMFFFFSLRYLKAGTAVALLILFLGLPSNIYLLIFSPDALFYSLFVAFFVSLFYFEDILRAVISGVLLGLLVLIKINAILLLPGVILFLIFEYFSHRRYLSGLVASALLAAVTLGSKMALGYALAGKSGLSFTAQHYASVTSQGFDVSLQIERLPLVAITVAGYLASFLLLLGMPLLTLLLKRDKIEPERKLAAAALLIPFPALLAFGMFWALNYDTGPYESIYRISLRYISFIFPFYYLFGLSILAKINELEVQPLYARGAIVLAIIVSVVMIFVIFTFYLPNLNESPELRVLTHGRPSLIISSVLFLLPFALMLFRPSLAARGYLISTILLASVWNIVCLSELRALRVPSQFDSAGRYAAAFLGPERADVAILATDLAGLFRTMFHLNAVGPIGVQLNDTMTRDEILRQLATKKWALMVGPDALKFAKDDVTAPNGFALVRSSALAR